MNCLQSLPLPVLVRQKNIKIQLWFWFYIVWTVFNTATTWHFHYLYVLLRENHNISAVCFPSFYNGWNPACEVWHSLQMGEWKILQCCPMWRYFHTNSILLISYIAFLLCAVAHAFFAHLEKKIVWIKNRLFVTNTTYLNLILLTQELCFTYLGKYNTPDIFFVQNCSVEYHFSVNNNLIAGKCQEFCCHCIIKSHFDFIH